MCSHELISKVTTLVRFSKLYSQMYEFLCRCKYFGKMTTSIIAIDAVLHSSLIDYELPFGALSLIKRLNPNFLNCWFPIQPATLEEYDKRWETFLSRNIRDILTAYRFKKCLGKTVRFDFNLIIVFSKEWNKVKIIVGCWIQRIF